MSIQTPNMSLYQPTIGIDSGVTWEMNINANASIVDGHNHSSGSGVQINPSGILINSDLPFNSTNNITTLRSTRYTAQGSPIALAADIGCTYVSGVDLYYNDVNGNRIQITSGGLVNATSSGISSGTASASFSGSVLIINSASNTPANVRCASVVIGNTGVSGSHYLTLSPPSALAVDYSIAFPSLPAQTNVVTLDVSGNLASITYDAVGQNMTSVGANAIQASSTRSTGSSVGLGGVAISSSCGNFSTSSGSFSVVTNLSVTLVTSGKPVNLVLVPDGTNSGSILGGGVSVGGVLEVIFAFFRSISQLSSGKIQSNNSTSIFLPPSALVFVDIVGAGTYTYTLQAASISGTAAVQYCKLMAWEL